jgi:hypothetical protein
VWPSGLVDLDDIDIVVREPLAVRPPTEPAYSRPLNAWFQSPAPTGGSAARRWRSRSSTAFRVLSAWRSPIHSGREPHAFHGSTELTYVDEPIRADSLAGCGSGFDDIDSRLATPAQRRRSAIWETDRCSA